MAEAIIARYTDLATFLSKLPFWENFDADAVLSAAIQAQASKQSTDKQSMDAKFLKEIFLELAYDSVEEAPEEEEGGEAEAEQPENEEEQESKPPKEKLPPKVSQHAEAVFQKIGGGEANLELADLVTQLFIAKNGFGEAAFRFAAKTLAPEAAEAGITEPTLWTVIQRTAVQPVDAVARSHLRRAWRTTEKVEPPQEEEQPQNEIEDAAGEDAAQEASEKPAAAKDAVIEPTPAAPREPHIALDDFVSKVSEDPRLQVFLLRDVAIVVPAAQEETAAE